MAAEGGVGPRRNRPISPHLGVYRWAPSMLVSILHRVTGDGLAILGGAMFLWWLGALATGPAAYADFVSCVWLAKAGEPLTLSNWIGRIVLVGLTWAFFQHCFSGLRHLLLDTGAGYELRTNRVWSIAAVAGALIATAATWFFVMGRAL